MHLLHRLDHTLARVRLVALCCSFEGPEWGINSTGAKRAACLRALSTAVEADMQVRIAASVCAAGYEDILRRS